MLKRLFDFLEGEDGERATAPLLPALGNPIQNEWDLEMILYRFSTGDTFHLRDACEGVAIFGSTGSGKSSGSGRVLAMAYLRKGFGGVVCCAKPDEAALWRRYARMAGRESDVVEFGSTEGEVYLAFNFLDFEMRRKGLGGGQTANVVELFVSIAEVVQRDAGKGGADPYWRDAMKAMLHNAVELMRLAKGSCSLIELDEIISQAPKDLQEAQSNAWRNGDDFRARSSTWAYLKDAEEKSASDPDKRYEYRLTEKYWLYTFPGLPAKQREGFVDIFRTISNNFLRGPARKLFCSATTLDPEFAQAGGIIIVNLPIKAWSAVGKLGNAVWLYMMMKSIEQREQRGSATRPVFLWLDEAHYFLMEACQEFQTTARSTRACMVALSQNLGNYQAMLGVNARAHVDSWLGNLNTKIFHTNADAVTNQWAADLISKSKHYTFNHTLPHGGQQGSTSVSETVDYDCPPSTFLTLRKGGRKNGCIVEGIVQMTGSGFSTGKTWFKAIFDQTRV